jgi:hypothetical protein
LMFDAGPGFTGTSGLGVAILCVMCHCIVCSSCWC